MGAMTMSVSKNARTTRVIFISHLQSHRFESENRSPTMMRDDGEKGKRDQLRKEKGAAKPL
jgi:hypothetical protein